MKKVIVFIILIMSVYGTKTIAQAEPVITNTQAIWATMLNKLYITDKFYVMNELHLRRANWGTKGEQFIIRPSVNYTVLPFLTGTIGYSFLLNTPYGEFPSPIETIEHNIWEEIGLKHEVGRFTIKHRYRLEHRFVNVVAQDSAGGYYTNGFKYAQRFRYRITAAYTIKKFEKLKSKLFVSVFDEMWLGLDIKSLATRGFNQNWFYVGVGYSFNQFGTIEIGYMNQVLKRSDMLFEDNHNIQITFSYDMHLKKKKPVEKAD